MFEKEQQENFRATALLRNFQLLALMPFFKNIMPYIHFLKFSFSKIISVELGKISEPLSVALLRGRYIC